MTEPPQDDWGTPDTPWNEPQQPAPPPPPPAQQWQQPAAPVGPPVAPGQPKPAIQNYLVPAILATVLCCVPTGIVSIVYAAQVSSKVATGDLAGAMQSSKNARLWLFISVGAGIVAWLLILASSAFNSY